MNTDPEEGDTSYIAFTRCLLDDMAAGRTFDADHYARLFPACADRIRADLPEPGTRGARARHASQGADEAETIRLPETIGKYEITGELPAGGMGRLLLARHPGLDEKFVIKTAKSGLVASDARMLDRLRREAVILGRLEHDGICPVTDVVIESNQVFVVMPFIEGETLEARLRHGKARMRQAEALVLLEGVARAIHAAHEKDVVHRDLKPGNIMVRLDGRPVVLDFGLAVDLSDSHSPRLTARGDIIGTPSYMAPEQIRSDAAAVGRRTDVYALGVLLYELLTFQRAFRGSNVKSVYERILKGRIDPPREVNPAISRDMEAVCLKAMEVDRRRRYATALELAEDLRRARTLEATFARPISWVGRIIRKIRR